MESDRREHFRVPGPFNGRWQGLIPVPLHIHDLSVGGCLVESYHEIRSGRRMTIDIELPVEGWVSLQAETCYVRDGYGFAVKFVDVPDEMRVRLERVVQLLLDQAAAAE